MEKLPFSFIILQVLKIRKYIFNINQHSVNMIYSQSQLHICNTLYEKYVAPNKYKHQLDELKQRYN
jgi:hypothetical protein